MTRNGDLRTVTEPTVREPKSNRGKNGGEEGKDRSDKVDSGHFIGLISVCLGFFIIQLDVTIVNVALPAIQRQIGGSLGGLQWVIDAYTLGLAAVMLTAGSQADRVGARRVFTTGLVVFGVGSAACAASPTLGVLIAARAVQGLGASALLPCSLALIVHQFPDRRVRARALGVWGGMGSAGVALGPVVGGALVAVAGWRSIFLVNVPVCALTIALLRRQVAESPRNPRRRADLPGLVLGTAALAGLTGGFITAGEQGWRAPLPVALLAAAVLMALLLVWAEHRQASPMLPLGLFRSVNLSAATGVGVLFNLCIYGALLCLSLYLQQGRGESALSTGLLILPMSAAVGTGSIASGPLTARIGPKIPMLGGLALAFAGAALLATAGPRAPLALIAGGSVLLGLVSLAMPAMTSVAVGAANPEHAGLVSGILNAARQSGGALGVALLGALLSSSGGMPGTAGEGGSQGGPGHAHSMALHTPLAVAAAGYLLAICLTLAIRHDHRS